ncbi:MAG: 50S ribosomal protein L18 [Clostridia bacterium]|nr:50S ribosomal protein L18 [Clostridia bacterium]
MINKVNKNELRKKRSLRVRKNVHGTTARPRLSVYRSLNHIYAQVINDENGTTIASASTVQKDVVKLIEGKTKKEAAFIVGEAVAKAAMKKGVKAVVFDRAGYLYTGRVSALADGARNAGLEF